MTTKKRARCVRRMSRRARREMEAEADVTARAAERILLALGGCAECGADVFENEPHDPDCTKKDDAT